MLFNSPVYILAFLPVVWALHTALARAGHPRAALGWLVAASLFFYAWWSPLHLPLLVASVAFNYALGRRIQRATRGRGAWLAFGVAVDLGAIAWFKYAGFAVRSAAWMAGESWSVPEVVLPLAISFFTFQQITYLVDAWRGRLLPDDWLAYAAFVTFFPQLIAGPIVRHDETIPQFGRPRARSAFRADAAVGLSLFAVGLFKKAVIADSLATWATPVFDAAASGARLGALESWGGTLAYTFQLYFDFSGYTDMALGSALLFGIRLPLNFDSPYKAASPIDFWRRWHVTLSRFLRDDLYIPLGGNRKGRVRRYANLMITMLLGGLWHGAGWTFVLWGGLHGALLVANHGWRALTGRPHGARSAAGRAVGRVATFVAVAGAWVLFRAADVGSAWRVYEGMAGVHGASRLPALVGGGSELAWLGLAAAIAWLCPNSLQWLADARPALDAPADAVPGWARWRPTRAWALAVGALGAVAGLHLTRVSEFLYFQF